MVQVTQVANNNKKDEVSKQMMKNIKIFDGTNKAECITWLSQVEAATRFTNTSFCEIICQSMVPSMLHILSELSALTSDEDIKNAILTNYSDIPSTTEAEDTKNNRDTNKETKTTETGMTTIKIETGLTIEGDQINISTTETNTKHKSFSNSRIRT